MSKTLAQTYEVGLFAGGANYVGDIGSTVYVRPNTLAYGALFKWNASTRYSWRLSLSNATIKGVDANSSIASRRQRGLSFKNTLTEFSFGLEVNFIPFNLHEFSSNHWSPYLHVGLAYILYDESYFLGKSLQNLEQNGAIGVPMIAGVKKVFNRFLVLGVELGVRYTFTDNLDGSHPKGSRATGDLSNFRIGNIFSHDWYLFSGITITYTFGRKPCYDCVTK